MAKCQKCEKELSANEIGLHKRLINRGADSYMCITCLARFFSCTEELLREKIVHYRNQGCTLFTDDN
ncbi:MAG: DUF2197 domain-containing protein [Clostridia bacterium]|nr:DUF2197 domain-containing protein [Clostridia bacterium]